MSVPEYLGKVYRIVDRAKSLGEEQLPNGTRLIGKVPHVAPEAKLHLIFPGLTEKDVDYMEAELGVDFPNVLTVFYFAHNGISLFSGSLSIYGLRRNYDRTGDNVWQPFDILVTNTFESPEDLKTNNILIGGYKQDGSRLCIDCSNGKVYRCSRESAKPLNEWSSFDEMILQEAQRLSKLFDDQGKLIKEVKSTLPL
jgi:hypothetical protein